MVYREGSQPSWLIVGFNGRVIALDRTSGRVQWERRLKDHDVTAVFLAITQGVIIAASASNLVHCLDYETGDVRWQAQASAWGRAAIVIEDDGVFVAKEGYLDCFALEDGAKRWSQPLTGRGTGATALGFPGNLTQGDVG